MNYTKAPTAATPALTYPIEQITVNLNNTDLQKLNSSPAILLPSGFSYCVLNAILDYDNINLSSGQEIWIGYENLLNGNIISNQIRIGTTAMGAHSGIMSIGANPTMLWYASTENYQPLVLWQQMDDPIAVFNSFLLTITYIKYT